MSESIEHLARHAHTIQAKIVRQAPSGPTLAIYEQAAISLAEAADVSVTAAKAAMTEALDPNHLVRLLTQPEE